MSRITDNELLREYRQAKSKTKQIKIMQDLYSLTKEEVLRKLRNAGAEEKELPKSMQIKNIDEALRAADDKKQSRENEMEPDAHHRQQEGKEHAHKKIPQSAVEAIEKEMAALKENISRDSARLKELAEFLGSETA